MTLQKKHGKGRLDKWYRLAKEKGYRARAAFKLIQLNKKFKFLENSRVLIDLCAAPGSWCQVATEFMPVNSLIVGVDLSPIKPISKCITLQEDITTDKCRAALRHHLKSWKADTVLHDGAPNVGLAWVQDAFSQAALVLHALRLATEFLTKGGTFVTKLFRSRDYNSVIWVFNQLFARVEATKPPSSRGVSAEIFVVCRGYKCPTRIDPRLLDARSVFEELEDQTTKNEATVFNPEKKRRKRDGYQEGDWTQFKELPATDFIHSPDPIEVLAKVNRLTFKPVSTDISSAASVELLTLSKLPETTQEVCDCCFDLKVLGRRDFRLLLKWRQMVRRRLGLLSQGDNTDIDRPSEFVETMPLDEDERLHEEFQRLHEQEKLRRKKERRRENEKKRKQIVRMQLNMTVPTEIGIEQEGLLGSNVSFTLGNRTANGQVESWPSYPSGHRHETLEEEDATSSQSEESINGLEMALDTMYAQYKERKLENEARYLAEKTARCGFEDEWHGFTRPEGGADGEASDRMTSDISSVNEENGSDFLKDGQDALRTYEEDLTSQTARFFQQDIFLELNADEHRTSHSSSHVHTNHDETSLASEPENTGGVLSVEPKRTDENMVGNELPITGDADPFTFRDQRDLQTITSEAMTLAQSLVSGRTTKQTIIDDGYNRFSFRDVEGLPDWFLEDENRHSTPQRPTTAAAAKAIKEMQRALNARPIKKVREAKARKKRRAAQKLLTLQRKSSLLADDEGMSEKDKAQSIAKLMGQAKKKKTRQHVKVVVAKGGNRGISGRPRGTKGKYKMVDARLKKDVRAEKRKMKTK